MNKVESMGFPVILKAVEGGGGRGLRIVRSSQQLKDAFISSKNESMISFGSGRVYVEKYVENPRHIEVQILTCVGNDRHESIEKMRRLLSPFRISGIPSTIPFHISALNDRRFVEGSYDTSFINEMKSFSSKGGEIAAAILSVFPKRIEFLKSEEEEEQDPWMKSRFDWIVVFDVSHTLSRWAK